MARASASVEMLGDKALDRKLRGMSAGQANKAVRKAMRPAFRPVLAEAKREAADVHNTATPTTRMLKMAKGLKIRALKRKRGRIGIRIVTPPDSETGVSAAHVELGTVHAPPEPFLRRPLHNQAQAVFDRMRTGIWENIRVQYARAS